MPRETTSTINTVANRPAAALSAPFSYTHRPGRSERHGPAGSGVSCPIPQNPLCMCFAKNGLASSQPRHLGPRAPRLALAPGGPNSPTLHLPAAPPGLALTSPKPPTLHLPYTYPTPPTNLPPAASQTTYPTPPDRPTLYPLAGLPRLQLILGQAFSKLATLEQILYYSSQSIIL